MRTSPIDSFDRMIDQLRRDMYELRGSVSENWPAIEAAGSEAAFDMPETDDAYVWTVEMPGFEVEEIELRSADGQLWLTAEHEPEDEAVTRKRSFREQVGIPRSVDADEISARYSNGVFEVTLPLVDGADEHGHRIDIN
jgi:HSP20 family protein